MPALLFEIITIAADVLIFIFIGVYLLKLRSKEKEFEKKEIKIDTDYHKVISDAQAKERKLLEDTAHEADKIIRGTQFITMAFKGSVDHTLQKIMADIQLEVANAAQQYMKDYTQSLKQLTTASLNDFQNVSKSLETTLQKDINDFHKTVLPKVDKEVENYKNERIKETDAVIAAIVQKVSQEILNKSLSLEDHQNLLIESLEKAKREGVFI